MSVVTQPMIVARAEDISLYADARQLAARIRAAIFRYPGRSRHLDDVRVMAQGLCVVIVEALRAASPREEMVRMQDVSAAFVEVRRLLWLSLRAGHLSVPAFDELMELAARGLREARALEVRYRRRARQRLEIEPSAADFVAAPATQG